MRFSMHSPLSRFVFVLLVALSLVGCSGPATSSSASADSMTLKVAEIGNLVGFFPFYVAIQQGYVKNQGVTLDPSPPIQTGTGAKMASAIESNSIEVAGGGIITDAFTLSRVDAHIRLLGALTTGYFTDVIVSKQFLAASHLTDASSLQDKVKALVGKKIGATAPGSGTYALLIYLFKLFGYDLQRDATVVNIGNANPAAGVQALAAGRIDALSFPSPTGQVAEAKGVGDIFISPERHDIPAMIGQIHAVVYAKQSVIAAKPKAIQAFIRAIAQAEAFIQKNPTQAEVLFEKFTALPKATADAAFQAMLPIMAPNPQISQQGFGVANQFHLKAGLIAVALPYNDVVDTATINAALSNSTSSS